MHALAKICIQRPVFATMLILSLMVVGAFSYFSLGVDLLPKVDVPTVAVTVSNPGASPEEIETEITKKIEDAVNTISGIDELRSSSSEGQAQIIVTFDLDKNGDVAAQEIQNKINLIENDLPQDAKAPVVQKFDPDATPVLQIAVSAPRSLRDVTLLADKRLRQKLENITGVGQIQLLGGAKREIHVNVDPERLRAYGLTVTDVVNAVRTQNFELPGGSLQQGSQQIAVRTMGRLIDVEQFNDIAIVVRQGYVVKVRDIGNVEDSYEEPRASARLNGTAAVTLVLSKQSGANSVEVARAVKKRLLEITPSLPKDIHTEIVQDQSTFIEAAINSIKHHLLEGSIFACVIIYLFLANWRTTAIAAVAIPTSLISTFALMKVMGFTLNQITMLALTLMVGIVVDDAIIVLENIYRFMEEKGLSPYEAAIEGTREIGLAVTATTLSLLAVFLPVGFMGGIVGRFMSSFGFTSAFAIAVSLLVSFTLTPMLCSRFLKPPPSQAGTQHASKESKLFRVISTHYLRLLKWSMAHRKAVLAICGCTMLSVVPLFMFVGKNFSPVDDQSQFNVLVRASEGTSLASTTQEAEAIAQAIRKLPGVNSTLTTVGGSSNAAVNSASIYVKLVDVSARRDSQIDLMQRTRELLHAFPSNLHSSVELVRTVSSNNSSNAQIQYYIQGSDVAKLMQYSEELLARLKKIPGVTDVDSSLRPGKPELRLSIDRPRASDLGVSVGTIAQALNSLLAGVPASTFNAGDDQYDVRVRAGEEFRTRAEEIGKIGVSSARQSGYVNLDQVVSITSATGPSSLDRIARQRQVTLSCNILPGYSQSAIIGEIKKAAAAMSMDREYVTGLAGESKQLGRSAYYFGLAFVLTFIFMYIVLAAQFESFVHPVTILLTLPLAVPFGVLSLLLAGQTVNIFSGLGLLLLFGIVKKNAILQIDHTNGLRASGMLRHEAILQANLDRLRPILMTTLALVAGMLPLVISRGTGAATNRSIGVLVVGGQSLCLLLTLLAVPVFYSIFEDLSENPIWTRTRDRVRRLFASSEIRKRQSSRTVVNPGGKSIV
jgi:HAE1 family hydrophobic/amphiphilic exporter-1